MPVSTFDFDELDAAEQVPSSSSASSSRARAPEEVVGDVLVNDPAGSRVQLPGRGRKRMSKARAWFEIRRFFDAEPEKHYGSPDSQEWKAYYAKELLLKSACEKLQSDGFVVIDAMLSPDYFGQLARQLLLEAPEQAAALSDHVAAAQQGARALGWVGEAEQARREELLRSRAGMASDSLLPAGASSGASEPEHDRALCESCLLSLAPGRGASSALRPQTKQQFFRFMRTYLHVVAAHSMSASKVRPEEKIPVQLCFGNIPRPESALTEPPAAPMRLEGPSRQAIEVD